MTEPLSPQAAQALAAISNIEGMLDRYKRILRIRSVPFQYNISPALRAVAQAHHALAVGWNTGLASVPHISLPQPSADVENPPQPDAHPEHAESRSAFARCRINFEND